MNILMWNLEVYLDKVIDLDSKLMAYSECSRV
jgi:hypothetical protein